MAFDMPVPGEPDYVFEKDTALRSWEISSDTHVVAYIDDRSPRGLGLNMITLPIHMLRALIEMMGYVKK